MDQMRITALIAALSLAVVACADVEEAPPPADAPSEAPDMAPGELTMPDWFQVDHDGRTVEIHVVAGSTSQNNHWNFRGFYGGRGGLTVPEGYTVTLTLENQDPAMGHSAGVGELMDSWPNSFATPLTPVFEGALTSNPTSMTESTMPGESETITFVADQAGEYALVCYVVGHAATGMWVPFTVSAEGDAGVTP